MAILQINKIHILGYIRLKKEILDFLFNSGAVEIIETDSIIQRGFTPVNISEIDKKLSDLDFSISFLRRFAEEKIKPVLCNNEFYKKIISEFNYEDIVQFCKNAEMSFTKIKNSKEKLVSLKTGPLPWVSLEINMDLIKDTNTVSVFAGFLPHRDLKKVREKTGKDIYIETISRNKKYAYFVLICDKEKSTETVETLRAYGFSKMVFPQGAESLSVKEYVSGIECELKALSDEEKLLLENIKKRLSASENLMILYDYFYNIKIKNTAHNFLNETRETFYLCGWILAKKAEELKSEIEKKFPETEIYFTQPQPNEDVPVFLGNNKFTEPFNFVTELYGHPVRNGIDPSPLLAPFFVIFFGFCLTDAAYGIILAILCFTVLKKMRLTKEMSKFFHLMFYCGLSTIVLGAVTGGWFGDLFDRLPSGFYFLKNFKNSLIMEKINPATQPLNFLVLALVLGSIQVLFGLLINLYYQLKLKNIFFAVFQQLPTIIIQFVLIALVISGMGIISFEKKVFIALFSILGFSMLSIAFTQWKMNNAVGEKLFWSIFTNYSIVTGNFLADTLSYARLFALGLSTGLMAMAVNEISFLVVKLPYYLGVIPMLVILSAGHLFNIAINMLGAYVHTSRLQYLEFFSKFYVSGGRVFKPFGEIRKYTVETR